MSPTTLFTHLKIISLQYFQFQFSISTKISSIKHTLIILHRFYIYLTKLSKIYLTPSISLFSTFFLFLLFFFLFLLLLTSSASSSSSSHFHFHSSSFSFSIWVWLWPVIWGRFFLYMDGDFGALHWLLLLLILLQHLVLLTNPLADPSTNPLSLIQPELTSHLTYFFFFFFKLSALFLSVLSISLPSITTYFQISLTLSLRWGIQLRLADSMNSGTAVHCQSPSSSLPKWGRDEQILGWWVTASVRSEFKVRKLQNNPHFS